LRTHFHHHHLYARTLYARNNEKEELLLRKVMLHFVLVIWWFEYDDAFFSLSLVPSLFSREKSEEVKKAPLTEKKRQKQLSSNGTID